MMKKITFLSVFMVVMTVTSLAQSWQRVSLLRSITHPQPMTGLVLWPDEAESLHKTYGNSIQFTRENIHLMKRFYMNFPIYHSKLNNFSWELFQLLLSISNKNERTFYYTLSVLFQSDYEELLEMINNHYYFRI